MMTRASIRIFDPMLKLKGIIANYESLMAETMWHGAGAFQIVINRHKNFVDHLEKGNIITIDGDYDNPYIILHKEIEVTDAGKISENWQIRGLELKAMIGRRITMPPDHTSHDNKSGDAVDVMRHYVNNNCISPVDLKRKMSMLIVEAAQPSGVNISWQSRLKNLAEELTEMSVFSGVGWSVGIDPANEDWIFRTDVGTDRTTEQRDTMPVVFSPQLGNLKMAKFVDSWLNYSNMAYVGGAGEGVDRRIVKVGDDVADMERFEMFVDARDISDMMTVPDPESEDPEATIEVPRPIPEVEADLTNRGLQKLAEVEREMYFEGEVAIGRRTERTHQEISGAYSDMKLDLVGSSGGVDTYLTTKTILSDPIDLTKLGVYSGGVIRWFADMPIGTDIIVEYSIDNGEWIRISNGDGLVSLRQGEWLTKKLLRFRRTLTTEDENVTPTMTGFQYEIWGYTERTYIDTLQKRLGVDYMVGDIVTVQNRDWGGVVVHTRVAGARRIYEAANLSVELIFGNNRPTLITMLKRDLKNMSAEVTR